MPLLRKVLGILLLLSAQSAAGNYQVKDTDTLPSIAADVYGAAQYELVIVKLNRLADGKSVAAGVQLRVPDLKKMLFDEGLPKNLEPEIDELLKARYTYMRARDELLKAMESPTVGAKLPSVAVKAALNEAANGIESAGRSLGKLGGNAETPTRMRQRLDGAAKALRKLAGGSKDKKLEASVHLLLAQAFVRGIMWARREGTD